jgi:hypothetical protein
VKNSNVYTELFDENPNVWISQPERSEMTRKKNTTQSYRKFAIVTCQFQINQNQFTSLQKRRICLVKSRTGPNNPVAQ